MARKDTENHYHFVGKGTHENEHHYSHTRHYPTSNATNKPDKGNVYHVLEGPGDNSSVHHKDPPERVNEYHVLEGPTPKEERGGVQGSGGNCEY